VQIKSIKIFFLLEHSEVIFFFYKLTRTIYININIHVLPTFLIFYTHLQHLLYIYVNNYLTFGFILFEKKNDYSIDIYMDSLRNASFQLIYIL
jgi:hypothetical protein